MIRKKRARRRQATQKVHTWPQLLAPCCGAEICLPLFRFFNLENAHKMKLLLENFNSTQLHKPFFCKGNKFQKTDREVVQERSRQAQVLLIGLQCSLLYMQLSLG
jgi:hypothetical protein